MDMNMQDAITGHLLKIQFTSLAHAVAFFFLRGLFKEQQYGHTSVFFLKKCSELYKCNVCSQFALHSTGFRSPKMAECDSNE